MKKRFAAVLTAGLAVSSLVGCQNNYSETTASASEQIADNSSEAVLEETSKKYQKTYLVLLLFILHSRRKTFRS